MRRLIADAERRLSDRSADLCRVPGSGGLAPIPVVCEALILDYNLIARLRLPPRTAPGDLPLQKALEGQILVLNHRECEDWQMPEAYLQGTTHLPENAASGRTGLSLAPRTHPALPAWAQCGSRHEADRL